MDLKQNKNQTRQSEEVATHSYEPSAYNSSNETDQGLAITHEQVSDTLTEGTIEGEIDDITEKEKRFKK